MAVKRIPFFPSFTEHVVRTKETRETGEERIKKSRKAKRNGGKGERESEIGYQYFIPSRETFKDENRQCCMHINGKPLL